MSPPFDTWQARLTTTTAPAAVVLIRFYVGAVFLFEGIQKFLYPRPARHRTLRQGRHPPRPPDVLAPLDGIFEIACGASFSWDCSPAWP